MMIVTIAAIVVVILALALVVMVVLDSGPPPQDVALAYEHAWDRFDFASLWSLSGDELRDGLTRDAYVKTKTAAYADQRALGHLARHIVVEEARVGRTIAAVRTRVELRDGDVAHNDLQLSKRAGRWVVVEYRLCSDVPPPVG